LEVGRPARAAGRLGLVEGSRFKVWGSRFGVQGLGFKVWGSRFGGWEVGRLGGWAPGAGGGKAGLGGDLEIQGRLVAVERALCPPPDLPPFRLGLTVGGAGA